MTEEEFQKEVKDIRSRLLATSMGYMKNGADSEDAVQSVLVRLWKMVDTLHSPLLPLALTLVRHQCVDELRRRRTTLNIDDCDVVQTEEKDERIAVMMSLIADLPVLQQTIIQLRHIDGMEMADIARYMGMKEPAVRKALSRARQALRGMIVKQMQRRA